MADLGGITGSVGSQAGAALETAGYHTQAQILDIFAQGFGSHAGGLLYLIALISAIIIISVGGSYRYGLWLLVGPSLFYFLTTVREETRPADWRMGERVHDQAKVKEAARGLMSENANVSLFFGYWNRLTSEVIQELITLMKITEKSSDLDFLNKTERYLVFWNSRIHDRHLKGFIQIGLINKCSQYFHFKRMLNDPHTPEGHKPAIKAMMEKMSGDDKIFNFREHEMLYDWVKQVLSDNNLKDIYSCEELWELTVKVVKEAQARGELDLITRSQLPDGLTPDEAWRVLRMKFGQRLQQGLTMKEAEASKEEVINEFAGRLITQEFNQTNRSLVQMNMDEQPQSKSATRHSRDYNTDTVRAIRNKQGTDQYMLRGELISGALYLPYLQGMLLYFLAVAFPFCALMVIVPGREGVMLLWMSLWLWAKLWDFGFAVVMLIDNMLYALLPHGPTMNDGTMNDAGKMWQALLETDPAYSAHTYYNLVACCLFAVPVVSGAVIARGGGDLVHAISQGMKDFTQNFGNSFAAFQRATAVDEKMEQAAKHAHTQLQENAWSLILSDKAALGHLENALAAGASKTAISGLFSELKGGSPNMKRAVEGLQGYIGTDKLVGVYADYLKKTQNKQGMARLKFGLQRFAYDVQNSEYSRQLAVDAVLQKWNSHDFRRDFQPSADAAAEYLQATYAKYGRGQLFDAAFNQAIKVFVKGKGN